MARSRATEASCQHTVGHWISAEEALRCQRKAYRPTNLQVCTYSVPVREMKEKVYGVRGLGMSAKAGLKDAPRVSELS